MEIGKGQQDFNFIDACPDKDFFLLGNQQLVDDYNDMIILLLRASITLNYFVKALDLLLILPFFRTMQILSCSPLL